MHLEELAFKETDTTVTVSGTLKSLSDVRRSNNYQIFCLACIWKDWFKEKNNTVTVSTLQEKSHLHLCISFLGIARPQSQFLYSCVCERFIYSQDLSTYFPVEE
jgi:hypothetical protein